MTPKMEDLDISLSMREKKPQPRPISMAEDRSLSVPPDCRVVGGYVSVFDVVHECRDPMSAGDVEAAVRRSLQLGDNQEHPAPTGVWKGERFHIHDGRHAHVAAILRGKSRLYVEWIEPITIPI